MLVPCRALQIDSMRGLLAQCCWAKSVWDLTVMLTAVECVRVLYSEEWWDQEFADSKDITGNLLEATPDVVEAPVRDDDEFLILATDGLW